MKSGLYLSAASALLAGSAAASCNADNCLRALRASQTPGRLQAAQSFCAAYTATTGAAAVAIPTYAANACVSNQVGPLSARLSSACACIGAATTVPTTVPTTVNTTAVPTTVPTTAVPTTTVPTAVPTEACAVASSLAAKASALSSTPRIPAAVAYDCLKTVPLHTVEAIALVDAMVPYMEWQSDAAYKANPPATYEYPAYDMFKALATVRENLVKGGVYHSEYDFQLDLYVTVIGPGHDGHFVFYPDLLTRAFDFGRTRSLVSISEDGVALPKIKVYEDVVASPITASEVVLINGIDAAEYLEKTIYTASFNQDKDAAYNSMFFSKAVFGAAEGKGYFAGAGRTRYIYHGANTTLSFANGTVATFENFANVRASLAGVTDGASMFKKFCSGASSKGAAVAASASPTSAAAAPTTSVTGFPAPVDITEDAIVSCYFLEGAGFENVAVLSLLAFESASIVEFQAVTANCIAQAKAAGKTKLVVDFSANGGGYILLGYDFFRQLFPQTKEDGFSRWKANDGYVAIGEVFNAAIKDLNPYTSADSTLIGEYESWFNYKYDLDTSDKHFTSFEQKFGPYVYENTKYTDLMKWDLNDNLTTTNSTYGMGIEISGYGTLANLTQPFAAEDIVILYDGFCASTCTIASEFLRINGGVKSVAMGGRPKEGAIQGVGGIKGSQTLGWADVYSYVSQALEQATTDEQRAALGRYTTLPMKRSSAASVNTRDQILPGNVADGLPAQFVVEEADCRLYYTAEMATDVTAVWKAAAHAAFNGGKCNAGGIASSASKINSRVDMRHKNRRSGASPAGVDKASLAKRSAVADLKAAEREAMSSKDMARFHAMYNQKIVV